jgi:hypothetical protein
VWRRYASQVERFPAGSTLRWAWLLTYKSSSPNLANSQGYVVACSHYTASTRICSKLLHGPGTPTKFSLQEKTQQCQFDVDRLHKIYWGLETSEGVTIGIESARPPVKAVFVTFTVVFLPCKLNNENPASSDRLFDDPTPLLCSSIVR